MRPYALAMEDGNRSPETRPRKMPWQPVAIVAVICSSLFVVGRMLLRAQERDCEWECFNFPAVVLLLGLAGIALLCLLVLVGMLGIWLVQRAGRPGDEAQAP